MLKNLIVLGSLLSLAQAGPCKPASVSTTDSISVATTTTALDTSSTAVVDTTTTEAAETTTTTSSAETTTAAVTTTTSSAETTTSSADETTTTSAATTTSSAVTTTSSAATTTSSAPSEPTACAIDPQCLASGWNVDYYANAFEAGYGNDEMTVDASYYITEGLTPLDSSVTDTTYFAQDYMSDLSGYSQTFPNSNYPGKAYYVGYHRTLAGGITVDANSFTLVYQGYYQAPSTGTYELCIQADNANTLYFGEGNAFNCGTGESSVDAPALVLAATGYHFNNPVRCGSVSLIKGHNYPVRNVMGNKNAVSMFEFTIKAPGETAKHTFTGKAFPVSCGLDY
ncbi:hypothetical protein AK830_g4424 [Neonectria ditissima]|uniref:PA14 domain-containing protein n=1 Tax=Neonectria ditissima TaxID=78410 RepID=A0A0P7B8K5_9HYPO|nr:hypothetical protein AK830_g4424 [Neonectria ditissima]